MGSIRRKTFTKPLPPGAELFTRKGETIAKWKTAAGKTRTAPVTNAADGSPRIVETASTFTAKYRDGRGFVVEVATGCRDRAAAEQRLAELERQAERVVRSEYLEHRDGSEALIHWPKTWARSCGRQIAESECRMSASRKGDGAWLTV